MIWLFLLILVVPLVLAIVEERQYKRTEYYQQTHNPYIRTRFDKGISGEFSIYSSLVSLPGYKRFLFNMYVPKRNGETTELDIVLLHESGLYIFESKNYSGWIFGKENQQYWTQTLPTGRGRSQKNRFYNPIMQNIGHMKWLRAFLNDSTLPFYSYIVFGNSCALKDVTLTSGNHAVIYQRDLKSMVWKSISIAESCLSIERIDDLFEQLYPLTQIDEFHKIAHIMNTQQHTLEHSFQSSSFTEKAQDQGLDSTQCPYCGGKLVLRKASKGARQGKLFWGCSNYPECKYIKNISDYSSSDE